MDEPGRVPVAALAVAAVLGGWSACRSRDPGDQRVAAPVAKARARSPAPASDTGRRSAAPAIEPLWQVNLAPGAAAPVGVHRGPRLVADGVAVESNVAGYAVVRADDGRVLRRRVHQPLSPRLPRARVPKMDWPEVAGHRYANVPGAVARLGDQRRAVAVDGGVGPAVVDAASGRRLSRGAVGPRVSVMSAAWSPSGALAVGVRFSGGPVPVLMDDAVLGFAADGSLVWTWSVPVPPSERGDPVGLWATDSAVYAFFDGRHLAALPGPGPGGQGPAVGH